MSSTVSGSAVSVKAFVGRNDLVCVYVNTHTVYGSASYNCPLHGITLNGRPAAAVCNVIDFACAYKQITATVFDPDTAHEVDGYGTRYVACDGIALTALE